MFVYSLTYSLLGYAMAAHNVQHNSQEPPLFMVKNCFETEF